MVVNGLGKYIFYCSNLFLAQYQLITFKFTESNGVGYELIQWSNTKLVIAL